MVSVLCIAKSKCGKQQEALGRKDGSGKMPAELPEAPGE